jgi:hypothetical protein
MGSDTIYPDTHTSMIGKSHATFVSHWCLQGPVSHIKIYWCLGGLLFGLDDFFRERVRALMMGLKAYILSDSLLHPSWVRCVFNLKNCFCDEGSPLSELLHTFQKNTQRPEAHAATQMYICYWMWNCQRVCPSALCKIARMGLSLLSKHV